MEQPPTSTQGMWQSQDDSAKRSFDEIAIALLHLPPFPPPHTVLENEFIFFLAGIGFGKEHTAAYFETFVDRGLKMAKESLEHPLHSEPHTRAKEIANQTKENAEPTTLKIVRP